MAIVLLVADCVEEVGKLIVRDGSERQARGFSGA